MIPAPKSNFLVLIAFFIAGFALRIIAVSHFTDFYTEISEYTIIAGNILNGLGYSYSPWVASGVSQSTSLFPPLYVYWCWIFQRILSDNMLLFYIIQAIVGALGVIPAYLLAKKAFNQRTGIIFSLLYAIYPEMVILPSKPVPEFGFIVMGLYILYFYLKLRDEEVVPGSVVKLASLIGVLTGILTLTIASGIVMVLAIIIYWLFERGKLKLNLWRKVLPFCAGVILVLIPWTLRNFLVQGEFIPLRSGYGYNLWRGNHFGGTGTVRNFKGEAIELSLTLEQQRYLDENLPADEQDKDRFFFGEAVKFIRGNPGQYLGLSFRRLQYFVLWDPTSPLTRNPLYQAGHCAILILSLFGFYLAYRQKKMDPIFPLIVAGYLLLYVPVLMAPRYRVMALVMILIFASLSLNNLWDRIKFLKNFK